MEGALRRFATRLLSEISSGMGGRGRPKKKVKKSGSVKKLSGNEGRPVQLVSESTPRTAVGKASLTPNSKSKYYAFHNKNSRKDTGSSSRKLFGGEGDVTIACDDDNRGTAGSASSGKISFDVKDFYSSGKYFFKQKLPIPKAPKIPSRRNIRTTVNKEVSKMGRPPLNGEVAMSEEEQKDRKRGLQELVRKRMKVRKIRQSASAMRKDRQGESEDLDERGASDEENVFRFLEGEGPGNDPFACDDDNSEQVEGTAGATLACEDDNSGQEAGIAAVTDGLDLETTSSISSDTFNRKENKFKQVLSQNSADQLAILVSFVCQNDPNFSFLLHSESCQENTLPEFSQSESTFFRRKLDIKNFIKVEAEKHPEVVDKILKNWAQNVASSILSCFMEHLTFADTSFLSNKLILDITATAVLFKLLKNRSMQTRPFSVKYSIELAQQLNLEKIKHGDISLFARVVGSSRKWAKKVLVNVLNKTEENLMTRSKRKSSVRESGTLRLLEDFLSRPENSRASPGETVSVAYGKRRPKLLLKKSKKKVLKDFLQEYPQVPFKKSVLLREFPANFVRATERDRGRNACPICANFRRRLFKLHSVGVGRNIALSTRAACIESMCQADKVLLEDATTWQLLCVDGDCVNCPTVTLARPEHIDQFKSIEINLWKKGPSATKVDSDGNAQEVFRLFPEVITIQECIENLLDSVQELKTHIYVTKWQWKNQRLKIQSLKAGDILTVEDYQMNMSVGLSEAPTTSVFGANQLTFTLYPIIVFYRDPATCDDYNASEDVALVCGDDNSEPGEDGDVQPRADLGEMGIDDDTNEVQPAETVQNAERSAPLARGDDNSGIVEGDIKKAAIAFISDDRAHGWEQIEDFNKRVVEIMKEEVGLKVKNWTRLSDGCSSQYKSKYTILKLTESAEMIEKISGESGI